MASVVFGEIQGLRALAVALVVMFHVWPHAISGGYIGVDVFFVISGYLITGSLARSALRDGSVDLRDFYNRRIRRLLPTATLVLIATGLGTIIFLPEARWAETVGHIVASAFYVENWWLAEQSIDYLASENAPSPVQHFWSLAVEEQFYLVWPFVIGLGVLFSRATRINTRGTLIGLLALAFTISLWLSYRLSIDERATAFFVLTLVFGSLL